MKIIYWIIVLILIAVIAWLYFFNKPVTQSETVYVHDTTIKTQYEQSIDTVKVPFFKKIYIKEVKADTIKYQRIDTAFIERQRDKDLMLGLEKQGTNVKVWALNMEGMLLKEQLFTNVYNDFSVYSATNRLVVKTKLWYWNKVKVSYTHIRPIDSLKTFTHNIELMTGVNYINRYSIDAGIDYDFHELRLKGRATVIIF